MKYEESFTEIDAGVLDLIKKTVPDSFVDTLKEAGINFAFPQDRELELKLKYDIREDGEALTLKISWDNDLYEEEEEEEEEEAD